MTSCRYLNVINLEIQMVPVQGTVDDVYKWMVYNQVGILNLEYELEGKTGESDVEIRVIMDNHNNRLGM